MKIHGWEGPNAATKPLVPPCLPCHKERTKTKHKTLASPKLLMGKNKTSALSLFISATPPKHCFLNCRPAVCLSGSHAVPAGKQREQLNKAVKTSSLGRLACEPAHSSDTTRMCHTPHPLLRTPLPVLLTLHVTLLFFTLFWVSMSPSSILHEDTLGMYTFSSLVVSIPCNPTLFP